MTETEFIATWELGEWIKILREQRFKLNREEFAQAGGPDVGQQAITENGSDRPFDDATIDQYRTAFTGIGDEMAGSLFAALLTACQPTKDIDIADHLAHARQEFTHSAFVVGRALPQPHMAGGEIYGDRIELDPDVSDMLTDTMKHQFVCGLNEIARYYKGLVLLRGPKPDHPMLQSLFSPEWMDLKPTGGLHFVGIVPTDQQSAAMYPFDPIAGIRTIRQAIQRATALGARRAEVIPVAWAILLANSRATPDMPPIAAWSQLAARGPECFTVADEASAEDGSDTGLSASGAANLPDQLPDPETIWRASTELLTPWRDDYALAAWDACITPGPTGAQLDVTRRDPPTTATKESLWVYDDSHYKTTLTTVLLDQGITCATLTDTALTMHEPHPLERDPVYWIPTGMPGRAVLRKASHQDWRAAVVA